MQKLLKSKFKNVLSSFHRCLNLDRHIYWNSRMINFTLLGCVVFKKRVFINNKNIFPKRIFPFYLLYYTFLPLETASQRSEFTAPRVYYIGVSPPAVISRDMMRDINTRVWKSRLACLEVKFGLKFCRAVYENVAFQLYSVHCILFRV